MTTWRDVEAVHRAHPKWSARRIAKVLKCGSAYVRATARRRGWPIPRDRNAPKLARLAVPLEQILPLRLPKETPHKALKRIVAEALARAV